MSNINTAARRKQWVVTGVSVAVALGIGGGVWAYTYHQSELKAQPKPKVVDMTDSAAEQNIGAGKQHEPAKN
jgi:conjugal transfer pilus assembly protein TraB